MYTNENSYGYTPYPRKKEPDYSNMTLRQELETRFADYEQQQKEQCIKPNIPYCYGVFDGQNFKLYRNNIKEHNLEAMSGKKGYQCKKYQQVPNKGPIPEGIYHMYQDQRQTVDLPRATLGAVPFLKKDG
uniref:Uncharacterized protein n=1 Tax=uncultured Alphaproteobacteria bacterium TaxID=91750 RepID=A0A6G8F280_9PROT|nr:hypothetical protein PlAlph_0800 [uncultured Alphaproteobacteria bacterium]